MSQESQNKREPRYRVTWPYGDVSYKGDSKLMLKSAGIGAVIGATALGIMGYQHKEDWDATQQKEIAQLQRDAATASSDTMTINSVIVSYMGDTIADGKQTGLYSQTIACKQQTLKEHSPGTIAGVNATMGASMGLTLAVLGTMIYTRFVDDVMDDYYVAKEGITKFFTSVNKKSPAPNAP